MGQRPRPRGQAAGCQGRGARPGTEGSAAPSSGGGAVGKRVLEPSGGFVRPPSIPMAGLAARRCPKSELAWGPGPLRDGEWPRHRLVRGDVPRPNGRPVWPTCGSEAAAWTLSAPNQGVSLLSARWARPGPAVASLPRGLFGARIQGPRQPGSRLPTLPAWRPRGEEAPGAEGEAAAAAMAQLEAGRRVPWTSPSSGRLPPPARATGSLCSDPDLHALPCGWESGATSQRPPARPGAGSARSGPGDTGFLRPGHQPVSREAGPVPGQGSCPVRGVQEAADPWLSLITVSPSLPSSQT